MGEWPLKAQCFVNALNFLSQLLPTGCYQMLAESNKESYMCRVLEVSGTLPKGPWNYTLFIAVVEELIAESISMKRTLEP